MITVLLIDHALECERSVRGLLTQLSADRFQVVCGSGYRAVLEGLRAQKADVCLIDSFTGNGLKLLSQARSIGRSMPVVLVTDNDAGAVVTAMRNGAADCLVRDQMTAESIERSLCLVVEQSRSASLQFQRERRYLALLDNGDEIVYTHDLDNNITSINQLGLDCLGYALPELLGRKASSIIDWTSQRVVAGATKRLLEAQTRVRHEVTFKARSGHVFAAEMNAHPIYEQGRPVEVQVLARLLSERVIPFIGATDESTSAGTLAR
ncbi:MAG TPA: PAS domain S-box protein [Pyrinomonadaceae bacterium]|nr:PAS domain S-box protein [Pyrinomonadaceae bacterium]